MWLVTLNSDTSVIGQYNHINSPDGEESRLPSYCLKQARPERIILNSLTRLRPLEKQSLWRLETLTRLRFMGLCYDSDGCKTFRFKTSGQQSNKWPYRRRLKTERAKSASADVRPDCTAAVYETKLEYVWRQPKSHTIGTGNKKSLRRYHNADATCRSNASLS